ncbi:Complement C5 [Oryzias melastigma]|uniref:Complement C5 n=1 Tax=Oryzias melastigma TaxID=30732 RepID=A0A834EZI4_ORYME|nr:Complement C5 [Oryzias melastigma]
MSASQHRGALQPQHGNFFTGQQYLVTAPSSFRVDALETVFVQLFGYTSEVTVFVFLKDSMAPGHTVLSRDVLILNANNKYQALANVQLYPNVLKKDIQKVVLHVQSDEINSHVLVPVSRNNGFLFIQTDKPLYTPHQKVKVRAFSMNQELRPANRSVFLTFKDPDMITVDVVEMVDINNGIPTMQKRFKIPIKPKLGIWTIEASYSEDFTTTTKTDFEVKEYVLPSIDISVQPSSNFISDTNFNSFEFTVTARYVHGAPVADGEVFLRYGYVSGMNAPYIIPNLVRRERLLSSGEVEVSLDMQEVLSKHDGPRELSSLVGKYLYIAVLVQEDTGGISQEAEFASVKFLKSPYHLRLISTPPFIKPGLPYNIQLVVKDHLDKPVSKMFVRLVEQQQTTSTGETNTLDCGNNEHLRSNSDGLIYLICLPWKTSVKAVIKFQTADPGLAEANQATLSLESVAYHSPNQRYLYINTPMFGRSLVVGEDTQVHVQTASPSYLNIQALNYLILSKGKVVFHKSVDFVQSLDGRSSLNFMVTPSMVPSIRLLVFYILHGEGTSELVADSVWIDVKDKCVNGLKTSVTVDTRIHKPKENLQVEIRANQPGLVALSVVDSAVYSVRRNYKDPISMVMRHIEQSDQGCGGGGGKDNADVFRLAGLTFMTNANAQATSINEACTAAVRPKRALSEEAKRTKAQSFGFFKPCCERGMQYIPRSVTCRQFALQHYRSNPRCREVFRECCEFYQKNKDDGDLILARHDIGVNFDKAPQVRSYFPESWMWEVQPISSGRLSVSGTLPDSLTTWEIKAVGMFPSGGMCVADAAKVSVNLPLSVDIPLPYQVVRGEQVVLQGSVYNQQDRHIKYCVTLMAGPAVCLLQSQPLSGQPGMHSTVCKWNHLSANGVRKVEFTLLGLEPGVHTLSFTLKTTDGIRDVLEKTLRVVPEGVRREVNSGGSLDPQGLYGSTRLKVVLKNQMPPNMVPNSAVQRMLAINGELPGDVVTVLTKPDGIQTLIDLPLGVAIAKLDSLFLLTQVYLYLETTSSWDMLETNSQKSSSDLKQKIRDGLVDLSSIKNGDSSYSVSTKAEPSTWVTAMAVKVLAVADSVMDGGSVDRQSLSESVTWLISKTQQEDGSFSEKSSLKPDRVMVEGADPVENSVYVTSVVLIALQRAKEIRDERLRLQFHDISRRSAAGYLSRHAMNVKSMYVRAVATYALTLHDPDSTAVSELLRSLENRARQRGNPVELRYWQEADVTADWIKPDQSSGQTVETTAYVLLTMLLKGRISYANPILSWLTQDQYYGDGFFSSTDALMALEAITEYKRVTPRAELNQQINIRYNRKGEVKRVALNSRQPVVAPIEVALNDDITVSTGYGKGVSNVKLKTVFYQTTASLQTRCNFELNIEMSGSSLSGGSSVEAPHLAACVKYKPPVNEVSTASSLTVLKIQLPTGVEPYLDDLRKFMESDDPVISHYELQGQTVVILMDTVPSDIFLCVGFGVRTRFKVVGANDCLFTVSERQDRGSLCTKEFSPQHQMLQRLCVGEQCQCMTAACAAYRGNVDLTLTPVKRTEELCQPHIKYGLIVTVRSAASEGDFMIYSASVVEVLKNTEKDLEALNPKSEVELVKKATCTSINLQDNKQYLVFGSRGSEIQNGRHFKYRLALDSEALVELLSTDCSSDLCQKHKAQMEDFSIYFMLNECL